MSSRIRTIVVGVAGLDDQDPRTPGGADPVLGPAVRLATELGAELHAVHAFEVPEELACAGGEGGSLIGGGADPAAWESALEERLERQLAGVPGGDAVHCWAVQGCAADALCRTAAEVDADLLVVGASRRGRAWAGILGSTAGLVIAASAIPVLVVHRPFARGPGRVLLTSDLSSPPEDAVRRAIAAVRQLSGGQAELRCLHVVDLDPMIAPPAAEGVLESVALARLDRDLSDAGLGPGLLERRVRVGDAGREIAREASEWGAELLVVGMRAHSTPGRSAGRVATAAVRDASCNVLVVPPAGARWPAGRGPGAWSGARHLPPAALPAG